MTEEVEEFKEEMRLIFDDLEITMPSDYRAVLDRKRPYTGQPHTSHGERGKTLVERITYRDLYDCFVIGAFHASGMPKERWGSIYDIDWDNIDPIAVIQNMLCEVERRQGIFPNVSELKESK